MCWHAHIQYKIPGQGHARCADAERMAPDFDYVSLLKLGTGLKSRASRGQTSHCRSRSGEGDLSTTT